MTQEQFYADISAAEHTNEHFNKLTAQQLVDQLQQKVTVLRELSHDMPKNWPEFSRTIAATRGLAYNGFRIVNDFAEFERRNSPILPSKPKASIDSLLGALE